MHSLTAELPCSLRALRRALHSSNAVRLGQLSAPGSEEEEQSKHLLAKSGVVA